MTPGPTPAAGSGHRGGVPSWYTDGPLRAGRALADLVVRHARLLGDPESMVALCIVTVWSTLAAIEGGPIWVLVSLAVGWFLHAAAVETGSHVSLWLSTAGLLIMVVLASSLALGSLPPVLLAAAGATVLVHNELIRLNFTRRRRALVEAEVVRTAVLGSGAAGVLAVLGVALATVLDGSAQRTWLWMPVATAALVAIGLGLAVLPARNPPPGSRDRWQPGERIPPPPTIHRDHEIP